MLLYSDSSLIIINLSIEANYEWFAETNVILHVETKVVMQTSDTE